MDLGFHLAMSYRNLKHPTSRKNFAAVVGQNHALILTQCHILTLIFLKDLFKQNIRFSIPIVQYRNKVIYNQSTNLVDSYCFCFLSSDILEVRQLGSSPIESNVQFATPITKH